MSLLLWYNLLHLNSPILCGLPVLQSISAEATYIPLGQQATWRSPKDKGTSASLPYIVPPQFRGLLRFAPMKSAGADLRSLCRAFRHRRGWIGLDGSLCLPASSWACGPHIPCEPQFSHPETPPHHSVLWSNATSHPTATGTGLPVSISPLPTAECALLPLPGKHMGCWCCPGIGLDPKTCQAEKPASSHKSHLLSLAIKEVHVESVFI